MLILIAVMAGTPAFAALTKLPKQLLESVGEAMGKSSDEAVQNLSKTLKHLDFKDIHWEKFAKGVDHGMPDATLLKRFQGLGDLGEDAMKQLSGMKQGEKVLLLTILEDSKNLFRVGVDAETVIKAVKNGGPDTLLAARQMKSTEGGADCIRGFEKYGEGFESVVRQGDESVVRSLMRHTDDLDKLPKHQLDDILKTPTKYFDAKGKSLKAFDDLVKPKPKDWSSGFKQAAKKSAIVAAAAGVLYCLCPDSVFDIFPEPFPSMLREIKWYLRTGIFLFLLWLFWWLFGSFVLALLKLGLRFISKIPGPLRKCGKSWLEKIDSKLPSRPIYRGAVSKKNVLRIGLLGSRRAGKSTFITMLGLKLGKLIEGAVLEPKDGLSTTLFEQIQDDVALGRRTTETIEVDMQLHWPYDRAGGGGHLNETLQMKDYPGEHVGYIDDKNDYKIDYTSKEYKKVRGHLENVDGLFVVIDPTELELPGTQRAQDQLNNIKMMFNESGINLGTRFKRCLGILVTKRDAIDEEWLKNHRGNIDDTKFDELVLLAKKREITFEESKTLGRGILAMLYQDQDLLKGLFTRLSPEEGEKPVSSYLRWIWPSRPQSAYIEVFAVSQLGFDLGNKVSKFREKGKEGEGEFPEPLDLKSAKPEELDFHHAFQWMFDSIPGGWLNELGSYKFMQKHIARWQVSNRFKGAPKIQENAKAGWWRCGVIFAMLFLAGALLYWQGDNIQRVSEHRQARSVFSKLIDSPDSNADAYFTAIKHIRDNYPTKPIPLTLDIFERMAAILKEMEAHKAVFDNKENPREERLSEMEAWFGKSKDITTANPENPEEIPELTRFLENIKYRVSLEASNYANLQKEAIDEWRRLKSFDNNMIPKIKHAQWVINGLDLPEEHSAKDTIQRAFDSVLNSYFVKIEENVQPLRAEKSFPEAIRILNDLINDPTLAEEIKKKAKLLRDQCFREYWEHTQLLVEKECTNEKFAEADTLLYEFLIIHDLPDEPKKAAYSVREELPDREVIQAVDKAKTIRSTEGHEKALKKLVSVQEKLDRCHKEVRDRWIEEAVDCHRALRDYANAIAILKKYSSDETKSLSSLWNSWLNYLSENIAKFIKDKNVVDARTHFNRLDELERTCPDDLVQSVKALKQKYSPILEVVEVIEQSKQDKKATGNLTRLWNRKTTVRDSIDDSDLCKEWLNELIDVFMASEEFENAVKILREIKGDPILKDKTGFDDKMIKKIQLKDYETKFNLANDSAKDDVGEAIRKLRSMQNLVAEIEQSDVANEWVSRIDKYYEEREEYYEALKFLLEIQDGKRIVLSNPDVRIKSNRDAYIGQVENRFNSEKTKSNDTAWKFMRNEQLKEMDKDTRASLDILFKKLMEEDIESHRVKNDYDKAIAILKMYASEDQKTALLEPLWTEWKTYLNNNIIQFIKDKNITDAETHHKRLDDLLRESPSEGLRTEADKLRQKYRPILAVAKAIENSKEGKKAMGNLTSLRSLKETISSMEGDDFGLCKEWLRELVSVFTENKKSKEGVQFLREIKDDQALSEKTGFEDRMIDELELEDVGAKLVLAKTYAENGDFDGAIRTLHGMQEQVATIDNPEKATEWLTMIDDYYGKSGKHLEALQFLLEIQNDTQFTLSNPDERINGKRVMYLTHIESRFRSDKSNAEAWRSLHSEWKKNVGDTIQKERNELSRKLIDETLKERNELFRKLIDETLQELDNSLTKTLEANGFDSALKQVKAVRTEFGEWVGITDYGLEKSLQERENRVTDGQKRCNIARIVVSTEYDTNYKAVINLLNDYKDDKVSCNELNALKEQILTNWEKDVYKALQNTVKEKRYVNIKEKAEDYLKVSELLKKESFKEGPWKEREKQVIEMNNWIKHFDESQDFILTAVRYKNMPSGSWRWGDLSDYDPAIQVEVNGKKLRVQKDNVSGDGSIEGVADPKFQWKIGDKIDIKIWQGKYESNELIGTIVEKDEEKDYALLRLAFGETQKVTTGNYRPGVFEWLRIGLEVKPVKDLPPMPKLPEHK